jgi:DNA-binding GntR family transcriptional regulator
MIQSRELQPGQRLRQAEIAAQFGVSTTPVREAFTALAQEGFVRQDAHRGVVVFEPSLAELTETFEIRELLEPLATSLAAAQLSDRELAGLRKLVAEMRTANPRRYFELNRAFHRQVCAGAKRDRMFEIIEQLREVAASYIAMTVRQYDQAYRDQVQAEHEALLAALVQRDGAQAGRLVYEHLRHNAEHIATLVPVDPE